MYPMSLASLNTTTIIEIKCLLLNKVKLNDLIFIGDMFNMFLTLISKVPSFTPALY